MRIDEPRKEEQQQRQAGASRFAQPIAFAADQGLKLRHALLQVLILDQAPANHGLRDINPKRRQQVGVLALAQYHGKLVIIKDKVREVKRGRSQEREREGCTHTRTRTQRRPMPAYKPKGKTQLQSAAPPPCHQGATPDLGK